MEIMQSIGFSIYIYSAVVYMSELLVDFRNDKPKVFSEIFWYSALFIGGLIPILNTCVTLSILKQRNS